MLVMFVGVCILLKFRCCLMEGGGIGVVGVVLIGWGVVLVCIGVWWVWL